MEDTHFHESYGESYFSLVCTPENGLPNQFVDSIDNDVLTLHAHQHPHCVVSALVHPDVPAGSIVMNEIQCLNSKVCVGEREDFTVFTGASFVYDGREGALGDTEVRFVEGPVGRIKNITMSIRPRYPDSLPEAGFSLDGDRFCQIAQKFLYGAIVSLDEVFQISMDGVSMVCRVIELEEAEEDSTSDYDEEMDFVMPDFHIGRVDAESVRAPIDAANAYDDTAHPAILHDVTSACCLYGPL